ncbi:MAG TPA: ribosomal protein S18-alanine N-acetyltransferase [Chloroflexota bacterium]
MKFVVEPMRVEHIPAVAAIERESFTTPWPSNAYRKEIEENRLAHYFVAKKVEPGDGRDGEDPEPEPSPEMATATARGGSSILERLSRFLRPSGEPYPPEVQRELESIVGYAGLWMMADEAHITTIAVSPRYRGRGVGELLLLALIDKAIALGARWVTLEVRVSNTVAQHLYRKYTFKEMGVRRRYYSDNGEDALIMWTEPLDSPTFREVLTRNRAALKRKLDLGD